MDAKRLLVLIILIAAWCDSAVAGETIYLIPSAGSCTGLPTGSDIRCITLQQFLNSPSSSANVTFYLQPGSHTITGNERLVFRGKDTISFISSEGAILDCSQSPGHHILSFSTTQRVYFENVDTIDCQCYIDVDEVIVQGGIWRATSATRAAIHLESVGNVIISNWNCTDYFGGSLGKCLSFTRSTVAKVYDSYFNNNGRISGSDSTLTVERCTFNNHRQGVFYTTGTIRFNITNSFFSGNQVPGHASGGVWQHEDGYAVVTISDSNFTNNIGGALYHRAGNGIVTLTDNIFTHNRAVLVGGAIRMSRCNVLTIINNVFESNEALSGGGAVWSDCRQMNIISSSFDNNTAPFKDTGDSRGGAIYSNNADVALTGSSFRNNFADDDGGAISVRGDHSSLSVNQSSFFNNTANSTGGGAIHYSGQYESVTITESEFSYNTAPYCAIIDIDEFFHTSINFTRSNFSYNRAIGQDLEEEHTCIRNATVFIIDSTFSHNWAADNAGVFSIDGAVVTIAGSSFFNNSAEGDGGVMYTYYYPVLFSVLSSQFIQNRAGNDAGVFYVGRADSHVRIQESLFMENSATDRGGVISLAAGSLEINRTNLIHNSAASGSVVSACSSTISIKDNLEISTDFRTPVCQHFSGNINRYSLSESYEIEPLTPPPTWQCDSFRIMSETINSSACHVKVTGVPCITLLEYIHNPSVASNIYMELEAGIHRFSLTGISFRVVEVENFTLIGNEATIDCSQSQNHAHFLITDNAYVYLGSLNIVDCQGQIYRINEFVIEGGSALGVRNSITRPTFYFLQVNLAVRNWSCSYYDSVAHGRCLHGSQETSMFVADSVFTNNRAGGGGALLVTSLSNLNVERCLFEYNRAQDSGGVIGVLDRSTATISCSTFNHNSAPINRGGVIYFLRSTVEIRGSSFYNNSAVRYGGVMYSEESTVNIFGSNFTSNSANSKGGALYVSRSGRTNVYNSTFSQNNATTGGGAAYVSGSTLFISGVNFINNTAIAQGANTIQVCGGGRLLGGENLQSSTASSCTHYNGNINEHSTESYCPQVDILTVGPLVSPECILPTVYVPSTSAGPPTDATIMGIIGIPPIVLKGSSCPSEGNEVYEDLRQNITSAVRELLRNNAMP